MCSQNKPNTRLYPIGRAPKLVPTYHPALGEHDHGHLQMGECQATCEGLLGAIDILHNTNLGSQETPPHCNIVINREDPPTPCQIVINFDNPPYVIS